MRYLATVTLAALTCSAFCENVKQIISQRYGEVTKAMQMRQLGPVKAILAPDFRAIAPNGKSMGRDDILKQFQFQANSVTDLKWPRNIVEFHVGHGVASATVSGHLSAYTKGKPSRHIELVATTRDTWKKLGGEWLLSSSELVHSKMMMDGKTMSFARH